MSSGTEFKIPTMDLKNGQAASSNYYYPTYENENMKYTSEKNNNNKFVGQKFGALLVLIAFSIVFGKLFVLLSKYISTYTSCFYKFMI